MLKPKESDLKMDEAANLMLIYFRVGGGDYDFDQEEIERIPRLIVEAVELRREGR